MRLATLAWRGLTARPLRSALTIIGVALGVALVSGTLLANQAATQAIERAAQEIFGKAELRGTIWTVKNVGDQPLRAGQRGRVDGKDGLTLFVRPE